MFDIDLDQSDDRLPLQLAIAEVFCLSDCYLLIIVNPGQGFWK